VECLARYLRGGGKGAKSFSVETAGGVKLAKFSADGLLKIEDFEPDDYNGDLLDDYGSEDPDYEEADDDHTPAASAPAAGQKAAVAEMWKCQAVLQDEDLRNFG
jgi:hypothetical protein